MFFQIHRKSKRIFNPKYANEGDIHVWDDDHIEWDIIDKIMSEKGLKVHKMIFFCITKTTKNIFIMNIRIYVPICELPHIKRIFKCPAQSLRHIKYYIIRDNNECFSALFLR